MTPADVSMKPWVENTVRALVDRPDAVEVRAMEGVRTVVLEVRCHPEDVGKVIGRNGKTVGAVRALAGTMAARDGRRAVLEIVE